MLYHMELLLGLYAITGCVYHAFPSLPAMVVVPCFVSVLGGVCCWAAGTNVELSVMVILAFVSNTVHWFVRWILSRMIVASCCDPSRNISIAHSVWQLAVMFTMIQLGVALLLSYLWKNRFIAVHSSCLLVAFFVSSILFLPIVSLQQLRNDCRNNLTFLSLFLPVLPCLVAGKLYMIVWTIWQEFESMADLKQFLWNVILPVYLRIFVGDNTSQGCFAPWLPPCLYAPAVVVYAPRMVQVGGGYVVGHFVASLAWIDVLLFAITQCTTRQHIS